MRKWTYTLAALTIACFSHSQNIQRPLKFYEDFNKEKLTNAWRNHEITENNKFYLEFPSEEGRFSDGFLVTETNPTGKTGAKRSELGIRLFDTINRKKFVSFSIKIPNSFRYDEANLGNETMVGQWHSKPIRGKSWKHYRENNPFNRPSIALFITTPNNKDYYLLVRYGNNGKPKFQFSDYVWSTVGVKKIETDKWYDLVFETKWSFTNAGYLASWINNEPFTPFNGLHNRVYGANMHNGSPAYFKFRQYRYFDDSNTQRVYFDNLIIGDSFDEVNIYDTIPNMFMTKDELDFIANHK